MSSLADLVLLAQSFLDPTSESALLPPLTMLEWLKPTHDFWDGISSVGLPWEMTRRGLSFGRTTDEFSKCTPFSPLSSSMADNEFYLLLAGDLSSQHSSFAIFPSHSFGIIILSASKENNAIDLHHLALEYFLPAFDKALIQATEEQMSGTWRSTDRQVELCIHIQEAALVVSKLSIGKVDALKTLNGGKETDKVRLWDAGNNEFR